MLLSIVDWGAVRTGADADADPLVLRTEEPTLEGWLAHPARQCGDQQTFTSTKQACYAMHQHLQGLNGTEGWKVSWTSKPRAHPSGMYNNVMCDVVLFGHDHSRHLRVHVPRFANRVGDRKNYFFQNRESNARSHYRPLLLKFKII